MINRRIPVLTLGITMVLIGLHCLVPDKALLYFSAEQIFNGQVWRLISGHLMHADLQHLLWNCLGLVVLGSLLEYRSRPALIASLLVGALCVNALLLTPFSQLVYYCGLSGVLNTLLLVALWIEWNRTRSWLIILIACGCIAKVAIEVSQGTSIVTNIGWPPYAWSHVAGLVGGMFVTWVLGMHGKLLVLRQGSRGYVVPLFRTRSSTSLWRSFSTPVS